MSKKSLSPFRRPFADRLLFALPLPALLAIGSSTWAASSTFTGGADSSFSNPSNWSNGVPGSTATTNSADVATFNAVPTAPSTTTISIDNNRNVFGLTFDLSAPAYTIGTDASLLRLTSGGTTQIATSFTGAGVSETVNAPVSLLGNYTFTSGVAGNTLLFGSTISGGNATNLTLTVGGAGNTTLNGIVSNGTSATFNVAKSGAGTLTVGNANTFNGVVSSSGGTIVATNTSAFGTNTAAVSGTGTSAGAIQLSGASTLSLYNDGAGSNGTITYGGTVGSTTTAYALTAISGSTLNLGNSSNAGGTGTATGNTVALGSLQINNTGTLTVNGLNGYGLSVAGVTNFGNSTTQGSIALSSNAPVTLNGGLVDFSTTSRNVGLQGTGTLTVNGGISTSGGGVTTVSAGTGTTSATAGVVVLNGASSYTGGTTITNGILRTSTATSAFGTGGVSIAATGVLDLRSDTSTTFSNGTTGYAITESAAGATVNVDRLGATATGQTLTVGTLTTSTTNPSSINFTGGNGYTLATGAVTVGNITTTFNPTTASVSLGNVTATTAGNVVLGGTSTGNSVAGLATGTGTLTKSGAGTWSINAASNFTGATTVNASGGTLIAGADGALASTSGITVNTGGMLALANSTANNNRVSDTAGITLSGGTISNLGVAEGTTSSVGLGVLTFATGTINFNNTAGLLSFANLTRTSGTLTISGYLNNGGLSGGPDRLIFDSTTALSTTLLNQIVFTGYGATQQTALGGGYFEVYPAIAAAPEPGTWAVVLLSGAALSAYQFRRRGRRS